MAHLSRSTPSPTQSVTAGGESALTIAIDQSARAAVSFFFGSGACWLVIGTLLALVNAFKLHTPDFLADVAWLTYGRTDPAELTALAYGWGCNAAFAIGLWLLARLSQAPIQGGLLLLIGGVFWNLGVSVAVIGILAGYGTPFGLLEMPPAAAPLLFAAYVFVGAWAIRAFRFGSSRKVFISEWFVISAFLWFPWLFSITQLMLFWEPVRGTVQAVVHAWFSHGLLMLWFAPIGLAAIYYFLPRISGRPISHYNLAGYGFWTLAACGGWMGVSRLVGGPVPAWIVSAGIAASMLFLVALIVITINLFGSIGGASRMLGSNVTLRFVAVGALSFVLFSLLDVITAFRGVAEVVQFTVLLSAQMDLALYAFFSMVAFGSVYYIVPKLIGREWPVPALVNFHFLASVAGAVLIIGSMVVAGIIQGAALNTLPGGSESAPVAFLDIVGQIKPYLFARTAGIVLLVVAHLAFALNVLWLLSLSSAAPAAAYSPDRRSPFAGAAHR